LRKKLVFEWVKAYTYLAVGEMVEAMFLAWACSL